jgi:RHS repeat-associated protein
MQIMNGQSATKLLVPLPAGGEAVYNASGAYYYYSDHLGSFRFASTSNRTMYFDLAHAPFGDVYASSGSTDPAFTGQRQDTVAGLYDFPAREYSFQGRWSSPDPAGLAAVDLSNPQSWDRYAYVLNNPLALVDPFGLDPASCTVSTDADGNSIVICPPSSITVTADGPSGSSYRSCLYFTIGCGGSSLSSGSSSSSSGNTLTPPTPTPLPPVLDVPSLQAAAAAAQYCRDNGHLLSFKIPFTKIPVTVDAGLTAGPFKYSSTNDIQTVIPLAPMGPPAGAGVGFTLKAGAPKDPAPQISYGMQNGLSAGFFLNPDGTHQGFVGSFGLAVGPLYSLVLPTNNACGMRAR